MRTEDRGISAAAAIDNGVLSVTWRFLKPGTPDLKEASGTLNGQPLATWQVQPYPGPNDHTEVLFLLDLSDQARAELIRQDKIRLLRLAGRANGPHFGAGIAIYSNGPPRLLTPADDNIATLVNMLAGSQPVNGPGLMGEALRNSLEVLAAVPAQRRAIVLFGDGHSDDTIDATKIVAEATRIDATISFVLSPSARPVARQPLEAIANATGGFVVGEAGFEDYLGRAFVLTDSGGSARAELPPMKRYFWQADPRAEVLLRYDGGTLKLNVPVSAPSAGPGDTLAYILDRHLVLVVAGAGVIVIVAGLAIFLLYRRRPAAPATTVATTAAAADGHARHPKPVVPVPPPHAISATEPSVPESPLSEPPLPEPPLPEPPVPEPPPPVPAAVAPSVEDINTGATYALGAGTTRIGRSRDNEIVLADGTVSRLQAVIHRGPDGRFEIENQSTLNPTLVNHALIERAPLAEGDLISLGKVTLRFAAGSSGR